MILCGRLTIGLLGLAVLTACSGPTPTRGIVLITLDTTRADRLGCYGYEDAETPHLDAFAAEAALFAFVLALGLAVRVISERLLECGKVLNLQWTLS